MTRNFKQNRPNSEPAWHEGFMRLLPGIRRCARHAFRNLRGDSQDEAIAEVTANALVAYARLIERGKADIAYATPLAMYAIKQVRTGRQTGGRLNVKDVSSVYCQTMKGVRLGRLDRSIPKRTVGKRFWSKTSTPRPPNWPRPESTFRLG